MPRQRRQILSRGVYEICFRTERGLPFAVTNSMTLLIESVLARVQRDHKVTLCHHLWMGNHPHMIVVARDAKQCTAFYGEVQKQLTESVKRLLGLRHLNLFRKNKTSVIRFHSVGAVTERIRYIYCNPAKAGIASSISNYLGHSSQNSLYSIRSVVRSSLSGSIV